MVLTVVTGPTASGKTDYAISLAERWGCEIISADSRQLYRDIPVATAAPTPEQLARVPHHMVGTLALDQYYSAAQYEHDVLRLLPEVFERGGGRAVLCGGSMMYIDAVCRGIDPLPTISEAVRSRVWDMLHACGLAGVLSELQRLDPAYAAVVDPQNPRRVAHALEICLEAGVPYSSLRTGRSVSRPFAIEKIALAPPRDELFSRINRRVEQMARRGLVEEARRVYPLRHLNSLNTVGLKEIFAYLDGTFDLPTALARMAKNTRVYAKKQLTYLRRDPQVRWLNPLDHEQ